MFNTGLPTTPGGFPELLRRKREELNAATLEHNRAAIELDELSRSNEPADAARVADLRTRRDAASLRVRTLTTTVDEIQRESDADDRDTRAAEIRIPTGAAAPQRRVSPGYTNEARTYNEHNDRTGRQFAMDVARQAIFNDLQAAERLQRHMQEERVERGGELVDRAVGSSAFSGLVVPQYLVDEFAPLARTGRPLADAMRHHDLPEKGMSLEIARVTTGTSVTDQANQLDTVSETDFDDTMVSIPVRTAAGSQTVSRQAVERGVGVEDTILQDLVGAYATNLDSGLINKATVGLSPVAASIAYTDASPTAAELYPKLLQGPSAVESALIDQGLGNTIAVMHSRRWYWLQSQLTSTWPLFGQPGAAPQQAGLNYAERYGNGFRGLLPSGTPVVLDNNIATNLGAGTNEDEIYFIAQSESHLWEDPNAPMLIKAEQNQSKKLGIDIVVYGYYAFTFVRRPHAQKIAGTGLVTPAFA